MFKDLVCKSMHQDYYYSLHFCCFAQQKIYATCCTRRIERLCTLCTNIQHPSPHIVLYTSVLLVQSSSCAFNIRASRCEQLCVIMSCHPRLRTGQRLNSFTSTLARYFTYKQNEKKKQNHNLHATLLNSRKQIVIHL